MRSPSQNNRKWTGGIGSRSGSNSEVHCSPETECKQHLSDDILLARARDLYAHQKLAFRSVRLRRFPSTASEPVSVILSEHSRSVGPWTAPPSEGPTEQSKLCLLGYEYGTRSSGRAPAISFNKLSQTSSDCNADASQIFRARGDCKDTV
eukprot:gnl/TRDRNA2_/TRDRNA2_74605_c0_seq1.p1 gnl/TRDRNA2_/TRDRNA2_74605_c0~~gnl/TRDRNA2_/TRDRNA2_74605_c0_seq1.p1  ORF type:complete len:150 (-),score=8.56 gnl/TRDRNA2_/TRDRNA2_74605_c0_seq1:586-1035(-)